MMSDVLPAGRMDCLAGCAVFVEVSESLWLSDSCLLVTGRRRMTAGRSLGGSMSVVMDRVMLMRDLMAAGVSNSLSSCACEGARRFVSGRLRGVAVVLVAPRLGVNNISLTKNYDKPVGDWISAPSPNFVAMATKGGPTIFCMVPLNRPSPKTPW